MRLIQAASSFFRYLFFLLVALALSGEFLDCLEAFRADHMLHPAGILHSRVGIHTQADQPVGDEGMALVHGLCNLSSSFRQGDKAVFIHVDVAVQPEVLHGDTDTWLGKIQIIDNIDRAYLTFLLGKDQDRFQIVFCGFLNFQI